MIDTERVSADYRRAAIRPDSEQLLVTNFRGTEQEADLSEPANCEGFGRIRHFHRSSSPGWPSNPLPIDPASHRLGLAPQDVMRAQVFQNAVCNWRCWYCFVPFDLLAASREHSAWKTSAELIDAYRAEPDPPLVIDLTGGQPDLTPEWVPWTMRELQHRGLATTTYVWSDDNLSNDYYWRYVSDADQRLVAEYQNYGRVGCFKGFDESSFAFNTKAAPTLFDRQFDLFARHLASGVDVYAYVTLTTEHDADLPALMARFVDRLQAVDAALPLRTVPLEILVFAPVAPRLREPQARALSNQRFAVEAWQEELEKRFSSRERGLAIYDVPIGSRTSRRAHPMT